MPLEYTQVINDNKDSGTIGYQQTQIHDGNHPNNPRSSISIPTQNPNFGKELELSSINENTTVEC